MQSVTTAMRIKRANEIFREGLGKALESLSKGRPIRVPTKVATAMLLNYPIIDGKSTQVRNIGAGVKELYLKEED